jgi:hypothetical protein
VAVSNWTAADLRQLAFNRNVPLVRSCCCSLWLFVALPLGRRDERVISCLGCHIVAIVLVVSLSLFGSFAAGF